MHHRPGFDSPDQAMAWVLLAYRDENGNIPRDGLMRAKAQADAMRNASRAEAQSVEAAGGIMTTAGITRGGWTWIGPSNIGGRVRAIAVHPTATNTLLAGSVAGGIWKSNDGGASWRSIDDFMANLAVSTILFRPGDPGRVYAATGEGFFNQDAIRGAGIFASVDEGETWGQLPSTANVDFDFVNRIAFSADGSILVAATRTGLFRSTDLGGSWTRVLVQADMMDVKFIAGSSTQAVASGRNRNAYSSNNAGQTWTPSTGFAPGGSGLRIELAVSRSAPNIVYASLDENSGQIWKSSDSGASYQLISSPAHLSTQGWYDNAIWVDPTNPDHVIAGGVSLFRSTNGGVGFTALSSCHSDQHAIVGDPGYNGTTNRRVYFGSDGGVCKQEDVAANFVTSLRNGLGITQFYGAGGHAGSGRVMGGTQDNGTLMYTMSAGSNAWSTEFGSDGGFSAIDPTDPNALYGEIQNFRIHRSLTGGTPAQYIYGGTGAQSCTKPAPYQITDACNGFANFIAPFILDPNEPNRLLAGGRSLWRTNDARTANTTSSGPSWALIKAPTTGNLNISAIAVAQGNSDIIWVGHNSGDLYVTLNGTAALPAWTRNDGALPNRTITSIAIDATDPSIVYVAFSGFSPDSLWRTMNSGATWQDVTGSGSTGLPDVPVRSITMHPTQHDWLYAATDVGVFASEDGGATWSLPHEGPSNVPVFQLFWMETLLVAVTHGRGLYTVPAATLTPSFARRPLSQGVLPGQVVTFNVLATGVAPMSYQWFRGATGDTSNPIAGATSTSYTTPPISQAVSYWVRATNSLGSGNSTTATLTPMAWGALIPGATTQNAKSNAAGTGTAGTSKATTSALPATSDTGANAAAPAGGSGASAASRVGALWTLPAPAAPSSSNSGSGQVPAPVPAPTATFSLNTSVTGRVAPFGGGTGAAVSPLDPGAVASDRPAVVAAASAGVSKVASAAPAAAPSNPVTTGSGAVVAGRNAIRPPSDETHVTAINSAATPGSGAGAEPPASVPSSPGPWEPPPSRAWLLGALGVLGLVLPAVIVAVLIRRKAG